MKSESADLSYEWVKQQFCYALATVRGQALPQQFQITTKILRVRVCIVITRFIARGAQAFEDILQVAAIDLFRGPSLVYSRDPRHALCILLHSVAQGLSDRYLTFRRTEPVHQLARHGKVVIENHLPRHMQRIACAGCGDEGIAVAVTANP